jgi:hypothetical protein
VDWFLWLISCGGGKSRERKVHLNTFGLRAKSNLPVQIKASLHQVLHRTSLQVCPPDILERITQVEAHVLRDLKTLDPARVRAIVGRMVNSIIHVLNPHIVGRGVVEKRV